MHNKGHRITFRRTLRVMCALYFIAAVMTLLTPANAAALDLQLNRTLSQTLSQLAKTKHAVVAKLNNGKGQSAKKQSVRSHSDSTTNTTAPETVAAPEPEITATPQTPPPPDALPPEAEQISSMSDIPSRQQLLNLVSKPLQITGTFPYHSLAAYHDANSFAVVRPSPEGWKILGVPWVWWAAGSGVLWLGNYWHRRRTP